MRTTKLISLLFAWHSVYFGFAQVSNTYLQNAQKSLDNGDFVQAQNLLNQVIIISNTPTNTSLVYKLLQGDLAMTTGDFEAAKEWFEQSLALAKTLRNTEKEVRSLDHLGIASWKQGNEETANQFLLQAYNLNNQQNNPLYTANNLNNRGLIMSQSDPKTALALYQEALDKYLIINQKNEYSTQILLTKNNMAIANRNLGNYFQSIEVFEEVKKNWIALYGENNPKIAFVEANIAQSYYLLKDYDLAIDFYQTAVQKYVQNYGQFHPELASAYNYLSNVYLSKNNFGEALAYNKKAQESNTKTMENQNNMYFDRQLQIAILEQNAEILMQRYIRKSLSVKDLKRALAKLDTCAALVDAQRKLLLTKQDKLSLGSISNQVNEMAIECLLVLKDEFLVSKKEYYQKIFTYIERSKGAILLDAVQDAHAKQFGGIPDSLLDQERLFVAKINDLENKLAQENTADQSALRASLAALANDYAIFNKKLEQDYPKYYTLKNTKSKLKLSEIQFSLDANELILNYFVSDRNKKLVLMKISKNKVRIEQKNIHPTLDKWIMGFNNSIQFSNFSIFSQCANRLYQDLFLDNLPKTTTHLIVLPHAHLNNLPFEALISKPKKEQTTFQKLNYLVNSYSISYHFSANLWLEKAKEKLVDNKQVQLFAPVNFTKYHLSDLPATVSEVNRLDSLYQNANYNSRVYLNEDASEGFFAMSQSNSADVLWLSTHGAVNTSSPDRSCIYLCEDDFSDGILYSGEIYGLSLDYNLVALSACQTGLGKVSSGEGVIGLSRALLYAGARNLMVSFWQVNDQSTAELMYDFTKLKLSLEENQTSNNAYNSQALREAKQKMIQSTTYASPYYWAAFVWIGR